MILAAGKGTRLSSYTKHIPKVLLPYRESTIIEHQLSWLSDNGVTDIVINLHYLGNKIKTHLGNGNHYGVSIAYSEEPVLLGTAGGVENALHLLSDPFVVVYGDIITDLDIVSMAKFHNLRHSIATVAIVPVLDTGGSGVVSLDTRDRITSFHEKPSSPTGNLTNAGIYILNKEALSRVLPDTCSDFGYDVFPDLISRGCPVYGYLLGDGVTHTDVGTTEKYRAALAQNLSQSAQNENLGALGA